MKCEPSDLGKLILPKIRKAKINQSELGRRCGISRAQISRIIYGKSDPSACVLARIISILDLDHIEALHAYFGNEVWGAFVNKTRKDVQNIMTLPLPAVEALYKP